VDEARRASRRRRWPFVIVGVVALLLVGAAAFWFWFVPHWRPPLREGEMYGVDVSAHQGHIEWERVAGDEIEFAYIKASEGGDHVDDQFRTNWEGAGAAGIDRGAYHFFTLCRPGPTQAHHFLNVAPPDSSALPPAVDLELAGNCSVRPPQSNVETELSAFIDLVEEAWGRPVVLYIGDDWEGIYPTRERLDRPLWHRRFLLRPNVEGWVIWQLHGYGRVEGIDGGVDLNVMRHGRSDAP
jgi:lysozyme